MPRLSWQAENNEADTEQDGCPVEFKMCLLPVVFTCLVNTHIPAASVVSPGHPSYRGLIIMQSTGSFMPGAGGTACTTTKGCYCFFLLFFYLYCCFFYWASLLLKPVLVMAEPLSQPVVTKVAVASSTKFILENSDSPELPDSRSTPKPLKTNKQLWYLVVL